MINKQRMIKNFVEMAKINSISGKEGKMAKYLCSKLKALGARIHIDNAGKKTKGETGNVIAYFPGIGKKSFMLCSHMDTVGPCDGVRPIIKKDRITSDGTTVLGADCKSGIAVILEVLSVIRENKLACPPIEAVFTVSEETGLLGAKFMDYSKIHSKSGMVLDSESSKEITVKAPAADRMDIKIHGYEAHAGMCPEEGISAIEIAAEAISNMKLGRLDHETTANVGVISGGSATNIVTPVVTLKAEARSHNPGKLDKQTRHMRDCFLKAAARRAKKIGGRKITPKVEFSIHRDFPNHAVPANDPLLKTLINTGKKQGIKLTPVVSGGGADANIFYGKGINTVNLGTGMWEVHTVREYLDLNDFFTSAGLVLDTLQEAGRN